MKYRLVLAGLIITALIFVDHRFTSTDVIDTMSVYACITPCEEPPKRYSVKQYSELQNIEPKQKNDTDSVTYGDPGAKKTAEIKISDEECKEIAQVYLDVLNGKQDFYPEGIYDHRLYFCPVNIKNFKNTNGLYFSPYRIGFVDFDKDGSREVVLKMRAGKTSARNMVLHYFEGKVYGYIIPFEDMKEVRTDGSFQLAKNDEYDVHFNLTFQKKDAKVTEICSIHYNEQYGNIYMLDDEVVSKDIYDMEINNFTEDKVKFYNFDRHEWREDLFSE